MKNIGTVLLSAAYVLVTASGAWASESQARPITPRVNLAFFEPPSEGTLKIQTDQNSEERQGKSQWAVGAPIGEAPQATEETGPVLADFRDRVGCATFGGSGLQGVSLCFKVMGDVSNLGLNEREVWIEGLENVVPSECTNSSQTVAFSKGSRDDESFTVEFVSTNPECPARYELTLKQLSL